MSEQSKNALIELMKTVKTRMKTERIVKKTVRIVRDLQGRSFDPPELRFNYLTPSRDDIFVITELNGKVVSVLWCNKFRDASQLLRELCGEFRSQGAKVIQKTVDSFTVEIREEVK